MEETTLWIMGLGPVIVHKQFVRDIGRRKRDWFLNGKPLPRDPRDALEQIYHFYGNKYYIITKALILLYYNIIIAYHNINIL